MGVELTGPHDPRRGSCNLCAYRERPRRVYELSIAYANARQVWRLCNEHIKEVRRALRGTIP